MKNTILLNFVLILSAVGLNAQHNICDCSNEVEQDLKKLNNDYNSVDVKRWFLEYFTSDKDNRKKLKKVANGKWGLKKVIDNLPIEFNSTNSTIPKHLFYKQIERETKKDGTFSTKHLEFVVADALNTKDLDIYSICLKACNSKGAVFCALGGEAESIFYLHVVNILPDLQTSIKLKEDIQFTNCDVVDDLIFRKGYKIQHGESAIQYLRRMNKDKNVEVEMNFENLAPITIEISGKNETNDFVPIGTIVASILDFKTFCQVNGIDPDLSKSTWLPCDGRAVDGGLNSIKNEIDTTPNLRGVFLRGVNTMYPNNEGAGKGDNRQLNPEHKNAGEFQHHSFQAHGHVTYKMTNDLTTGSQGGYVPALGNTVEDEFDNIPKTLGKYSDKVSFSEETRPNNVSVYYYIKVRK